MWIATNSSRSVLRPPRAQNKVVQQADPEMSKNPYLMLRLVLSKLPNGIDSDPDWAVTCRHIDDYISQNQNLISHHDLYEYSMRAIQQTWDKLKFQATLQKPSKGAQSVKDVLMVYIIRYKSIPVFFVRKRTPVHLVRLVHLFRSPNAVSVEATLIVATLAGKILKVLFLAI